MAAKGRGRLRVLFVDDEPRLRELMADEVPEMGHTIEVCADGTEARSRIDTQHFDVALVDLRLPDMDGLEVLEHLRRVSPETAGVILTGNGTLENAIEALRLGATDFLTKPCQLAELELLLDRLARNRDLEHKRLSLDYRLQSKEGEARLVGRSPAIEQVRDLIAAVAPTTSTVLIVGETGTGKELVARAIHDESPRRDRPFVPIDCGALPETLVESELFGHSKGAFTGADQHRKGLFEVADGGTVLLDEIGDLNANTQTKLLRLLESGEIRRVGENVSFTVNVRVIGATNRDLESAVAQGAFRQDLYYRVNIFSIHMPPLREHTADVPLLVEHLLDRLTAGNRGRPRVTGRAVEHLRRHSWPGNVRELANVLERAAILARGRPIDVEHLPPSSNSRPAALVTLKAVEADHIRNVLDQLDGNKTATAAALGISLRALYYKLDAMASRRGALSHRQRDAGPDLEAEPP